MATYSVSMCNLLAWNYVTSSSSHWRGTRPFVKAAAATATGGIAIALQPLARLLVADKLNMEATSAKRRGGKEFIICFRLCLIEKPPPAESGSNKSDTSRRRQDTCRLHPAQFS